MKNTNRCPKCNATPVLRIEGQSGVHGAGNNIPTGVFSAVLVTRFVCTTCGFTEEWIEAADDLQKLAKKYG